jgi:hypothetical protein
VAATAGGIGCSNRTGIRLGPPLIQLEQRKDRQCRLQLNPLCTTEDKGPLWLSDDAQMTCTSALADQSRL